MQNGIAPVAARERLHEVDVIRGVAILGILIVNMPLFFSPLYLELLGKTWFPDPLDTIAKKIIVGFAQGKFYTTFSLLFGFGLAIQFERFRDGAMAFRSYWFRRMGVLLAIGLIHALAIWFGDILTWYALGGMVLYFFAKAKPRTLLIWAVVLILVSLFLMTGLTALGVAVQAIPKVAEAMAESQETMKELADVARERYPVAGFGEAMRLNVQQWMQVLVWVFFTLPNILAMFLIGMSFARRRVFHEALAWLPRARRAIVFLVPLAILSNGGLAYVYGVVDPGVPSPASIAVPFLTTVGGLTGCLTYVSLLLLAYHSPWAHRLVAPFGAVGRMALTNYLTHSIVFTTLANGYGFGLYGRISTSACVMLTLATVAVQIVISNLWLRSFRFGPLEWAWRCLTYGRLQPMRRPTT